MQKVVIESDLFLILIIKIMPKIKNIFQIEHIVSYKYRISIGYPIHMKHVIYKACRSIISACTNNGNHQFYKLIMLH